MNFNGEILPFQATPTYKAWCSAWWCAFPLSVFYEMHSKNHFTAQWETSISWMFLKEFSQLWAFGMFLKEKQNVYIADNSSKLAANT